MDLVAVLAPWGKLCPASCNGSLATLLTGHLIGSRAPEVEVTCATRKGPKTVRGHFRVGAYAPDAEGRTRWLCLDFDGDNHPLGLVDPQAAAIAAHGALRHVGLPAYLERSGSAAGWHVWVLFDLPVSARRVRALGLAIAPAGLPLAGGGVSDPKLGRGVEVFPKQSRITKRGCGSAVWLPGWHGAKPGGSMFYKVADSGALERYTPETLETVTLDDLERVLREFEHDDGHVQEEASKKPADPAWAAWRRKALTSLPLETVYGEWLTGSASGEGWLRCHDPASPTGDRNPSAGVADGSGDVERGSFHSFISGRTISVFDFLIERGRARDIQGACALVAELSGVPLPHRVQLPLIMVSNRQLRDTVREAWDAVHAANQGPDVFQRIGTLVRVAVAEGDARLDLMNEDAVYGHLARVANWLRLAREGPVDSHPDHDTAKDMMINPDLALPHLERITFAPVFASDGSLVLEPGYHRQARLWLHLVRGLAVPSVPENPRNDEIATARDLLLNELLGDFPFAADSDRAHAVAAILLQFVRDMVRGPTPIHLIESPTPGSGKGLLSDVISLLFVGHVCHPTTIARDEDESRKKITSVLARGQAVILIDNVRGFLESSQIASAITAEVWSDRILGKSRMVDLPNRATWIVTGNNPRLSLEIARRCLRIRLDPKVDRPWQRTGFRHPELREWALENRTRLIWAALVLVQGWIAAGRPRGERTLGSFEGYATTLGGILATTGIAGFLGDAEQFYERADAEGREWREFTKAWWDTHAGAWVSASDLHTLATEREILLQVLGEKNERSQKIRLGKALQGISDRQFGTLRIVTESNPSTGAARYQLIRTDDGKPADSPDPTDSTPLPASGGGQMDLADIPGPDD
jgi:hypothetical protein